MTHIPRIRPKVIDTLVWIGFILVMGALAVATFYTISTTTWFQGLV